MGRLEGEERGRCLGVESDAGHARGLQRRNRRLEPIADQNRTLEDRAGRGPDDEPVHPRLPDARPDQPVETGRHHGPHDHPDVLRIRDAVEAQQPQRLPRSPPLAPLQEGLELGDALELDPRGDALIVSRGAGLLCECVPRELLERDAFGGEAHDLCEFVVAAALLSLPFLVSRRRSDAAPAVAVPGRWRLLVYFAALGLGFMIVEISMIQRFALLLGYPTLSLSVSLFTLLLATALGARFSDWIQPAPRARLWSTLGAMWAVGVVYLLISDPVTDAVLAWSEPLRIGLVFVLLFPVGVLLGMFLPTGIDRARAMAADAGADDGRLVAWCWAVNGFFSVIGSTSTTMMSMTFGFDRTLVIGLVLYVAATAVMATSHPRTGAAADMATAPVGSV